MPSTQVTFTVPGVPTAKGSVRAFPVKRKDGRVSAVITHDNRTKNWEAVARLAAKQAWTGGLWEGAITLEAVFWFPRPNHHYKGGKPGAGRLKPNAPVFHTSKPDEDKLQRALRDALTGVIYRDDSQIAVAYGEKRYADFGETPRTEVEIRLLQNSTVEAKPNMPQNGAITFSERGVLERGQKNRGGMELCILRPIRGHS